MFLKLLSAIRFFTILYIAVVICDTVTEFGSLKAALQYDRELLESEVAKRPHLIMFYAPWYESVDIDLFTSYDVNRILADGSICGLLQL